MNKIYKSFSLCLAISMLFCFVAFAEDVPAQPTATMSLSSDKTVVTEGDTLTLSVKVTGVVDTITGGTIALSKTDNALITFGDFTYPTGYTAGAEGSFTLETPAPIADNTVICTIPVTIGKLPAGILKDNIQLGNLIAASCTLTKEGGNALLTVTETPITVTINKKLSATITLKSTIPSLNANDFKVELVKDETTKVDTILSLLPDRKTIAIDSAQAIEIGVQYTVVVTGAGYLTSDNTTFTSTDGSLAFSINNFLAGDINADDKIDMIDFNDLCTKKHNNAQVTTTYDLNRDGKIDSTDISYLVSGWIAGGAF